MYYFSMFEGFFCFLNPENAKYLKFIKYHKLSRLIVEFWFILV